MTSSIIKVVVFILSVLVITVFLYQFLSTEGLLNDDIGTLPTETAELSSDSKIVSFGPSITELIYKLDLQDQLVGNTIYCKYPEAANNITKIGSLFSINYELLLALGVDAAIVYSHNEEHKSTLDNFGIKYIEVDHNSIDSILNSMKEVGATFGKQETADKLVYDITTRMEKLSCANPSKKKIMYVVHRDVDFGGSSNITVVGHDTYYNDMIELAGGINVFKTTNVEYPIVDIEAITRANPDIIIEAYLVESDIERLREHWQQASSVSAVQNDEIYFLSVDDYSIPGPRFIDVMDKMFEIICQE